MEELKLTIKDVLPNVVGFVVLLITLRVLNVTSFMGLAAVLGVFAVGVNLYQIVFKKKRIVWWRAVLGYLKSLATLSIIIWVFRWSAAFGVVGVLVVLSLYSMWRLFGTKKRRFNYMSGLRSMETAIWGKSLDKANWGDGELKALKYKLKGGKSK